MQELEGKTFASLKAEGEKLWEGQLSKFKIEATPEQRETFYTSVYHAFLHPFIFQDADGKFRELDKNIGQAEGLPIIPSFLCGILTGHYIPYSIWCNGISMPISSTRCWPIMTRVSNICCRSGRFMATKPGV